MVILDTAVWIEFLRHNPAYFVMVAGLLERNDVLAVECVFGELLQGAFNERERLIIRQYWQYLPKVDIQNVVIEAGVYSNKHKLLAKGVGLIDAIILLHGIKTPAPIWTLDKKFLSIIPKELVYN
ncbi:putative PIN domain protein [Candidatus Termititenax persephonae]|uniref:PIN domain protein n=1 Tax=Candidatus Termititenax persephonae TaxID=2218525 RepID=A0A388TG57_9BACT|nr:putative PIN domain protein [Candidatus Termititenax persephonae]